MSNEPGVVSATIELNLLEPGSPSGLLSLAGSFERVGYTNLARYLRSCAEAMLARPAGPLADPLRIEAAQAVRACLDRDQADDDARPLELWIADSVLEIASRSPTPGGGARAGAPLVLLPVLSEIARATRKFPTWPTDPLHALGVVGEEFGELGKAVLQAVYEPHKSGRDQVREEAIQTAAMAVRFIASLDVYDYTGSAHHQQHDVANERLAVESLAGTAGC